MTDFKISDKCSINTNWESDTFVGIKCEKGDFSIHFPLGFRLSDNDRDIRRDIILLMSIIKETTGKKESEVYNKFKEYSYLDFPFQAYLAIIYDFLGRGYYRENEVVYNVTKRGKIDWNRTIKTQKPVMQGNNAYYLSFVTKKSVVNENELISLIHEYCVYDSFRKIGWLFTDNLPEKPRIKYNYKLFRSVLIEKLSHTFNDKNKKLFRNMLAALDYEGDSDADKDYKYGTNRFEYVWESMVDRVYGIQNKEFYFPKTKWRLDIDYDNAFLEPDSIMLAHEKIFVLDAKYYKFGMTKNPWDLPESTSINKQITYGEFIAENHKFDKLHGKNRVVYNAFILPFDSESKIWKCSDSIKCIGEAISDWKSGDYTYEHIVGILIDVKTLMRNSIRLDNSEIIKLSTCIESFIEGVC